MPGSGHHPGDLSPQGLRVPICKMGGWALNSPPHPAGLGHLEGGGWGVRKDEVGSRDQGQRQSLEGGRPRRPRSLHSTSDRKGCEAFPIVSSAAQRRGSSRTPGRLGHSSRGSLPAGARARVRTLSHSLAHHLLGPILSLDQRVCRPLSVSSPPVPLPLRPCVRAVRTDASPQRVLSSTWGSCPLSLPTEHQLPFSLPAAC